jgi:hypothetical protein
VDVVRKVWRIDDFARLFNLYRGVSRGGVLISECSQSALPFFQYCGELYVQKNATGSQAAPHRDTLALLWRRRLGAASSTHRVRGVL